MPYTIRKTQRDVTKIKPNIAWTTFATHATNNKEYSSTEDSIIVF